MKGLFAIAFLAGVLMAGSPPAARAAEAITAEEAHAIGVDAYLYFYPLVSMDVTRKQLTNGSPSRRPSAAR